MFRRNKTYLGVMLFSVLLGVVFFSCDASFSLAGELNQAKLEIYPASAFVNIGQTIDFYAEGGEAPYSFEIADGPGTIDPVTGVYTAAMSAGNAHVNVVDSAGRICTAPVDILDFQPDVDYELFQFTVTENLIAGASFEGSFFIHNNGSGLGVVPVTWSILLSSDNAISADDNEVAHGQIEAVIPGADSSEITFSANWPMVSGAWYVLISIDSSEDIEPANDVYAALYDIAAADIDYIIENNTLVLNSATVSSGSSVNERFRLYNTGTSDGNAMVIWSAYISFDSKLDSEADTLIQYGTLDPLKSAETSADLMISQGHWPISTSDSTFYLIVTFGAGDENPDMLSNNILSASITVTSLAIDYEVASISSNSPTVDVGSSISETFSIKNSGTDNSANSVSWNAYISLNPEFDSSDQLLESGVESPLFAGTTSAAISFSSSWPVVSGQYYLIISLSNSEDQDENNNIYCSNMYQVINNISEPDYFISEITHIYPVVTTDSIIAESVSIMNLSSTAGSSDITWTAYASTDEVFGSDSLLGSGTISAIPGPGSSITLPIYAHWPSDPGEYYLFIQISAADELTDVANNTNFIGPFVVYDKPDYSVEINNNDLALYELCNTPSASDPKLAITNVTTFAGQASISWEVFCSNDTNYSTDDILFASGGLAALAPSESKIISFNGTWPDTGGYHYLIARIYAIDDTNGFNDIFTSRAVALADTVIMEVENNDSRADSTGTGWSVNSDLGITLESGDSVVVIGYMDTYSGHDVFKFSSGTLVTSLSLKLAWNSGYDDADFYVYAAENGTNPILTSAKTHPDFEPSSSSVWNNFTELSDYYLDVVFGLEGNTSGSEGTMYSVMLVAP